MHSIQAEAGSALPGSRAWGLTPQLEEEEKVTLEKTEDGRLGEIQSAMVEAAGSLGGFLVKMVSYRCQFLGKENLRQY